MSNEHVDRIAELSAQVERLRSELLVIAFCSDVYMRRISPHYPAMLNNPESRLEDGDLTDQQREQYSRSFASLPMPGEQLGQRARDAEALEAQVEAEQALRGTIAEIAREAHDERADRLDAIERIYTLAYFGDLPENEDAKACPCGDQDQCWYDDCRGIVDGFDMSEREVQS